MAPLRPRRRAVFLATILLATPAAVRGADLPATPPAAASPCAVAIAAPLHETILYGPVVLRAAVSCPGGRKTPAGRADAAAGEVVFLVDGREAGRAAGPPYEVAFDAGGSFTPRLVEARLTDGSGRIIRALLMTRGAALTESVRVASAPPGRVTLSVRVTDGAGGFARGLGRDDFSVLEAGRERPIDSVREESRPLSAALLIDASGSTATLWPALRRAAPVFARTLGPEDAVKVVAFSGPACLVQDFTRDPGTIEAAMARFRRWGGGTSLYDTLAAVGVELAWRGAGRQAVIVLTDGVDTLSRIDARRLRDYLRRSGVVLEALLLRPPGSPDGPDAAAARAALEDLARESGGSLRLVADPDRIDEAFREVGDDLRERYAIVYETGVEGRDDWRRVEVRTRRVGLAVVAPEGVERERDAAACLIDDLRRGDVAARSKAAEWIGRIAAPAATAAGAPATAVPGAAVEALLDVLSDRAAEVRAAAAAALGRLREARAAAPLAALLQDGDETVRRAAAQALPALGVEAVPPVLDVLERGGEEARIKALAVLASIHDERAVAAIVALARPPAPLTAETAGRRGERVRPDPRLRAWALWAVGRVGRPADVPLLLAASGERDPRVREAALRALGESGDPRAVPRLVEAAGLGAAGAGADDAAERDAALSGLFAALQNLSESGRLEAWALGEDGADPFLAVVERAVAGRGAVGGDLLSALGGAGRVAAILGSLAAGPPEHAARARVLLARLGAAAGPAAGPAG